jgi:cysteine desulfuration protein SufE
LRLALLIEYAGRLPEVPSEVAADEERFERVEECQSPLFLASEVRADVVSIWFDAPLEAPITRGFASVLYHGLDGRTAQEVRAVPPAVTDRLRLVGLVSPLRLRGMGAMLQRLQRQVRVAAVESPIHDL